MAEMSRKMMNFQTCNPFESRGMLHEYPWLDGPSNFLQSHDTETSLQIPMKLRVVP